MYITLFLFLLTIKALAVKRAAADGNCFFWDLIILVKTVSFHFVFIYLIADVETVLCCAE
jgi:hypothetical protein